MNIKLTARHIVSIAAVISAAITLGCNGADNPKIVDAPPPPKVENPGPPKIPGRKDVYGASTKYQKAMENAGRGGS
jgi:hypothetical protein